jgi:AcrR family transcriptional regulator
MADPPPGPLVWSLPEPPRSAQPSLSREQIVRAAIKIADAEGAPAATMRRVAAALGSSTPMSLYRYVGSKDGLVDLMLDAACGEVTVPDAPTGDWRADLRELARQSWAMTQRHPWYAELVHTRPPVGPNALRLIDFGLSVLSMVDSTTAMTYLATINSLTIGTALQAAEEQKMRRRIGVRSDDELRAAAQPLHERIVATGRYPHYNRWVADGGRFLDADGFELVLDILLDGIAARLGPR